MVQPLVIPITSTATSWRIRTKWNGNPKEWKLQKVMAGIARTAMEENALGREEMDPHIFLALVSLILEEVSWLVYLKNCYCKKKKILAKNNIKMHKICRYTPWCKLFMQIMQQRDQELAWISYSTIEMCSPSTNQRDAQFNHQCWILMFVLIHPNCCFTIQRREWWRQSWGGEGE